MKVWVVGKALFDEAGGQIPRAWDMQGVFSTEGAAVMACGDFERQLSALESWQATPGRFFVGPLELDDPLPVHNIPEWPGSYYP